MDFISGIYEVLHMKFAYRITQNLKSSQMGDDRIRIEGETIVHALALVVHSVRKWNPTFRKF